MITSASALTLPTPTQEPGLRAQASGLKQQALKPGPGLKPQANKLTSVQATSRKLADRGAWIKFRGPLTGSLDTDVGIRWVLDMEGYLVWRKCNRITFSYFQLHCEKSPVFSISNKVWETKS